MKSVMRISLCLLLSLSLSIYAMDPEGYHYQLDVLRRPRDPDSFKISISKSDHAGRQHCSFITNFATGTCEDKKNLFAPFDTPETSFVNKADTNTFLWKVEHFGLLTLDHTGSTSFGHSPHEVPLASDTLTIGAPGKLVLRMLKVAKLHAKAPETQLHEMIIADELSTNHLIYNKGSLQVASLVGGGKFCNEARLEFKGTQEHPAQLGIKLFQNGSKDHPASTVSASHLQVTGNNHKILNRKDAQFDVTQKLVIDATEVQDSFVHNQGLLKVNDADTERPLVNDRFIQANRLQAGNIENRRRGYIDIVNNASAKELLNDGTIDVGTPDHAALFTIGKGINRGRIDGKGSLKLSLIDQLINSGSIQSLDQLGGTGTLLNRVELYVRHLQQVKVTNAQDSYVFFSPHAIIEGVDLFNEGTLHFFGDAQQRSSQIRNAYGVIRADVKISASNGSSLCNEGECFVRSYKTDGEIRNQGQFDAHLLEAATFDNKETGKLTIWDKASINKLDNNGAIEGSLDAALHIGTAMKNFGHIKICKLLGAPGSSLLNHKELLFHDNGHIQGGRLTNTGLMKARSAQTSRALEIHNLGDLFLSGDMVLSNKIHNEGTMHLTSGKITDSDTPYVNKGNLLLEQMQSRHPLQIINEGTLQCVNSSLHFKRLQNDKDLLLRSGTYKVDDFKNKKLQLCDNDWAITNNATLQAPHKVELTNAQLKEADLGQVQAERKLIYDLAVMPNIVNSQGDITCSNKFMRAIDQLYKLKTSGKVTAWCDVKSIADRSLAFADIAHLELFVNGALTKYGSLTAPALSLHVQGPLIVGKSNAELATIAATHGPLHIDAHSIDGRFAKFYGKGKTLLESTRGDIQIGSPARGVEEEVTAQFRNSIVALWQGMYPGGNMMSSFLAGCDYTVAMPNGAYVSSDDDITVKSATSMTINGGTMKSHGETKLIAPISIDNIAGKVSSDGSITIETPKYNHLRLPAIYKYNWPPIASNPYTQYPGSVAAILESLKNINFKVGTVLNRASSIRSSVGITINGLSELSPATGYNEEQISYLSGAYYPPPCCGNWYRTMFAHGTTLQAGKTIQMNLGNFVVTGNWNAPGILMFARAGEFSNGGQLTRTTRNATRPFIVDVTDYMRQQAQRPGFYQIGAQNAVQTEFSFGTPSVPQEGDLVALENPQYSTPLNWQSLFNPLSSISLDMPLQRLLGDIAGKVYAGKARGNKCATVLWSNANRWRQQHGKKIMTETELQQITQSMLLSQIARNGMTEEQKVLLCIAPQDIDPYQDAGDIVSDKFRCEVAGDVVCRNNRIIAQGPEGITLASRTGDITLQTDAYTIEYGDGDGGWVTEQRAYPQQQLIAPQGSVHLNAYHKLERTGTAIAAGVDVIEQAQTGPIIEQQLTLKKSVTKREEKDEGLFSTTTKVTTNLSHQVLPSTTVAGREIYDRSGSSIHKVATQDVAGQSITYESPNTIIQGLILADRVDTESSTSSMCSNQSRSEMKETPFMAAASMSAPLVRFVGDVARINANIKAYELHDDTRDGIQFVRLVKEMLYSQQTLVNSPLMKMDAGCKGGYEVMIQPMLMVERIIRANPNGHMLFESAIMDKDRTEIIGKFVETTYQLKKWQEEWCHKDQLVSDEALVVVAAAIALATEGMAVELFAPMLEGATLGAMFNAGFTTICATAGTSLLRTGDPLQMIEQLGSTQFLKSLAFDVASAGLCSRLGGMTPGTKSLMGHMKEHVLRSTVDTLLNVAIHNAPIDKVLRDSTKQGVLKAVAAYVSNGICSSCLDKVGQKVAHTALGGAVGFAMDGNSKGLASGAVGALTAQTVGELLTADAFTVSDSALARLKDAEKPMTVENVNHAIQQEVNYRMKIAKAASGAIAAATGLNPSISMSSAANVIDNDMVIRAQIYAMGEMQSLLTAASQAVAHLEVSKVSEQPVKQSKREGKKALTSKAPKKRVRLQSSQSQDEAISDAARTLVLNGMQQRANTYDDLIVQCADEWRPHNHAQEKKPKRSLADRIINPEMSPLIKETSEIIRVAFADAVNKTVDTYAMIPNPVGLACFAAGATRDIYQERTTVGELAFNTAVTYGALKGIQLTGKGIKLLYQKGKSGVQNITESVLDYLGRNTAKARVPFVQNAQAGSWKLSEVTMSDDLILNNFSSYLDIHSRISRNPAGPFNVISHGARDAIMVSTQTVHPKGLSKKNRLLLEQEGQIVLDKARDVGKLIKTAPGYVGQHVNLMACNCGTEPQGIAQRVATYLRVPVSAFNGKIIYKQDGSKFAVVISERQGREFGVMKTFYPESNKKKIIIPVAALQAFLLSGSEHETSRPSRENIELLDENDESLTNHWQDDYGFVSGD